MKTTSAVAYLHDACHDQAQDINVLMKDAAVLAQVLRQRRFIAWHKNEEAGYAAGFPLPGYRREVSGTLLTHRLSRGWTRAELDESLAQQVAHADIRIGYLEVMDIFEEHRRVGFVRLTIPEDRQRDIANKTQINARMALLVPVEAYAQILESCRAVLRRWSGDMLKLGVRGQGMRFSANEREAAQTVDALIDRYQVDAQSEAWQNAVRSIQASGLLGRLFRMA